MPSVYTVQRSSGKGDKLEEFVTITKNNNEMHKIIHGLLDMEIV